MENTAFLLTEDRGELINLSKVLAFVSERPYGQGVCAEFEKGERIRLCGFETETGIKAIMEALSRLGIPIIYCGEEDLYDEPDK